MFRLLERCPALAIQYGPIKDRCFWVGWLGMSVSINVRLMGACASLPDGQLS